MKIVRYPHPALRHESRPLTSIDQEVRLKAGQMLELMYAAKGLGLAANQVSWPYQLFVCNFRSDPLKPELEHVLINPVIVESKGTVEGDEGCLSFPELFQKVRRAKTVTVQAYNLKGELVEIVTSKIDPEVNELASRVLQHEIDHLKGVLYIDKMGPLARRASRTRLRELEQEYRKAQERGEIPADKQIEKTLAGGTVIA